MLPRTGGPYVFIHAAYGPAAAFVFGWLYLLVATPAAIGALATFFAELLLDLWAPSGSGRAIRRGRLRPGLRDHRRSHGGEPARDAPGHRRPGDPHRPEGVGHSPGRGGRRCRRGQLRAPRGTLADGYRVGRARPGGRFRDLGLRRMDRGEHDRGRGGGRGEADAAHRGGGHARDRAPVPRGERGVLLRHARGGHGDGHRGRAPVDRGTGHGARRRRLDLGADPLQRVRGAERQHPRQAPRLLRPLPRRPDLRISREGPPDAGRRLTPPSSSSARGRWRSCGSSATSIASRPTTWWWSGRRCCSRWGRSSSCAGACRTRRGPFARPDTPGARGLPLGDSRGARRDRVGRDRPAVPNYSPVWGLLLSLAGFPAYALWRRGLGPPVSR